MSGNKEIIVNGFWDNNAVFAQLLGMCPLLAVTTSAVNGIGMGLASTAVLLGANIVVSMMRKFIPGDVRIPAFIVVIASFTTIVDLMMNAFVHDLHKVLGIFIPLIVVNCVILGRAEAFASKNSVGRAALDGISTGLGFTLALFILGSVRELLGTGKIMAGSQGLFGTDLTLNIFGADYHSALVFILPPGAFIALGFILVGVKMINQRREAAKQKAAESVKRAPASATA